MFRREDRYRETAVAGLALLAMAVLLGLLVRWLIEGAGAAGDDLQRFQSGRAQRDVRLAGAVMMILIAVAGSAAAGLAGLGIWLIVGGAWSRRRGRSKGR
jgi:hypothetical protein